MGQNHSAVERLKNEVVQAVHDNNARRLYQLFMLATRHQLGEIAVVPGSGSGSVGAIATQFIQSVRNSGPAVGVEEYLKTITHSGNPQYVSFDDNHRQGGGGGGGGGGYGGGGGAPTPPISAAAQAASSVLSGLSSWFKGTPPASSTSSPYATLAAHPRAPPPMSSARQPMSSSQSPSAYSSPPHPPPPPPVRPALGGYAPPTMSPEQHEEAQKTSEAFSAPMANLPSTAASPAGSAVQSPAQGSPHQSGMSTPIGGPMSGAASPGHLHPGGSHGFPAAAASTPASPAAAEFSAKTLPINVNQLWVGSDLLLTYAAKQDQTSIIHLLYQAGAEIEAADSSGWSALTHAAAAGSVRAVRALLDIGADPLAKTKTGLTPSQCTSSPEIRKELEVEENERRANIEVQVGAHTATRSVPLLSQGLAPPSLPPSFSSATSASSWNSALCEILVPVEIRSGARFDVQYRCPPKHSDRDCLSVYYVDSEKQPWSMSPRMGVNFYIPTTHIGGEKYRRMTIVAESRSMPPGLYRLVYYDASTASFPGASNLFHVIAQPSAGTSSSAGTLAAWFDPAAWTNPQSPSAPVDISNPSSSSSPIILHPDFQLLSSPSPANLDSFLVPIPPYFLFSFTLNPVAVRLALELDPDLALCRDQLVPHRMKEKDFWASYFYKMVALDWRSHEDGETAHDPHPPVQDGPIENNAETPRAAAAAPAPATTSTMLGYQPPVQAHASAH